MNRTWLLCILLVPGFLSAQPAPVLRQIKVPHSYYYREMYLPQLTTGPSSVLRLMGKAKDEFQSRGGSL